MHTEITGLPMNTDDALTRNRILPCIIKEVSRQCRIVILLQQKNAD